MPEPTPKALSPLSDAMQLDYWEDQGPPDVGPPDPIIPNPRPEIEDFPYTSDITLSPDDETAFGHAYSRFAGAYGLHPDPDEPKHFYNYRRFWKAEGGFPNDDNPHLSSRYKHPDHPNRDVYYNGRLHDTIMESAPFEHRDPLDEMPTPFDVPEILNGEDALEGWKALEEQAGLIIDRRKQLDDEKGRMEKARWEEQRFDSPAAGSTLGLMPPTEPGVYPELDRKLTEIRKRQEKFEQHGQVLFERRMQENLKKYPFLKPDQKTIGKELAPSINKWFRQWVKTVYGEADKWADEVSAGVTDTQHKSAWMSRYEFAAAFERDFGYKPGNAEIEAFKDYMRVYDAAHNIHREAKRDNMRAMFGKRRGSAFAVAKGLPKDLWFETLVAMGEIAEAIPLRSEQAGALSNIGETGLDTVDDWITKMPMMFGDDVPADERSFTYALLRAREGQDAIYPQQFINPDTGELEWTLGGEYPFLLKPGSVAAVTIAAPITLATLAIGTVAGPAGLGIVGTKAATMIGMGSGLVAWHGTIFPGELLKYREIPGLTDGERVAAAHASAFGQAVIEVATTFIPGGKAGGGGLIGKLTKSLRRSRINKTWWDSVLDTTRKATAGGLQYGGEVSEEGSQSVWSDFVYNIIADANIPPDAVLGNALDAMSQSMAAVGVMMFPGSMRGVLQYSMRGTAQAQAEAINEYRTKVMTMAGEQVDGLHGDLREHYGQVEDAFRAGVTAEALVGEMRAEGREQRIERGIAALGYTPEQMAEQLATDNGRKNIADAIAAGNPAVAALFGKKEQLTRNDMAQLIGAVNQGVTGRASKRARTAFKADLLAASERHRVAAKERYEADIVTRKEAAKAKETAPVAAEAAPVTIKAPEVKAPDVGPTKQPWMTTQFIEHAVGPMGFKNITQAPGQLKFGMTAPNGMRVHIHVNAGFKLDPEQIRAQIGRAVTAAEIEQLGILGAASLELADGSQHNFRGLVELHQGLKADGALASITLRHELLHIARQAGLLTDAEWQKMVKKYSSDKKGAAEQEEDIAKAMGAFTNTDMRSRVMTFIRRLVNRLFGGSTGLSGQTVMAMLNTPEIWSRTPTLTTADMKPSKTGAAVKVPSGRTYAIADPKNLRPFGLAIPFKETPIREAVTEKVDRPRAEQGEQKYTHASIRAAARKAIDADREGVLKKLLEIANNPNRTLEFDLDQQAQVVILAKESFESSVANKDYNALADFTALMEKYRISRGKIARTLGFGRDPVSTRQERRNRRAEENLMKLMESLTRANAALERRINGLLKVQKVFEAERLRRLHAEKEIAKLIDFLRKIGVDPDNLNETMFDEQQAAFIARRLTNKKAAPIDYLIEYRSSAGLLSGPYTSIRNISGTWVNFISHATAQRVGEAMLNISLIKSIKGGRVVARDPHAARFGEFKFMLPAFFASWSQTARHYIKDALPDFPLAPNEVRAGRVGRMSWLTEVAQLEAIVGQEKGARGVTRSENLRAAIPDRYGGRIIRGVGYRHLLAADEFSKAIIAQTEVAARAYRTALYEAEQMGWESEKEKEDFMSLRMHEEVTNYDSKSWNEAMKWAVELSFQKPGKLTKALLALRRVPVAGRVYHLQVPFLTAPTNILGQGFRKFLPIGLLNMAYKYQYTDQYKQENGRLLYDLAEQLLGAMSLLAIWSLMDDDDGRPIITGSADGMSHKDRVWAEESGMRPYTIRVGDWLLDYSMLEPAATTIATCVDFLRGIQRGYAVEEESVAHATAANSLKSIAGQLHSKSFIRGLSDLAKMVDREDPSYGVMGYASSFGASLIPNIIRSPLAAAREYQPIRSLWPEPGQFGTDMAWHRFVQKTEAFEVTETYKSVPRSDLYGRYKRQSSMPIDAISHPATDWLWRMFSPVKAFNTQPALGQIVLNRYNQTALVEKKPLAPKNLYPYKGESKRFSDENLDRLTVIRGQTADLLTQRMNPRTENPDHIDVEIVEWALRVSLNAVKADLIKEVETGQRVVKTPRHYAQQIMRNKVQTMQKAANKPFKVGGKQTAADWREKRALNRGMLQRLRSPRPEAG